MLLGRRQRRSINTTQTNISTSASEMKFQLIFHRLPTPGIAPTNTTRRHAARHKFLERWQNDIVSSLSLASPRLYHESSKNECSHHRVSCNALSQSVIYVNSDVQTPILVSIGRDRARWPGQGTIRETSFELSMFVPVDGSGLAGVGYACRPT